MSVGQPVGVNLIICDSGDIENVLTVTNLVTVN